VPEPTFTVCAVPAFATGRVGNELAYAASAAAADALPVLDFVTITWNRGQFADVADVVPVPLVHAAVVGFAPLDGTAYVGFAAVVDDNVVVRPLTCDHT
jgi:hypothetical protein